MYKEMHFLTKENFLRIFRKNTTSFEDFVNKAQVRTSNGELKPLLGHMKSSNISRKSVRQLYQNVVNREEYLGRFYDTSLEPVLPLTITEKPMPSADLNNNAEVKYKNTIRNMYYREILRDTQSGFDNVSNYWSVIEDLYLHDIIDYKLLTPSAVHYTAEGRLGSVFSSFYFRASIMNPYIVYSINKRILKGTKIFTPTLGWSSYSYGFLESGVEEYVGNDVIPSVCKKTGEFVHKFYPDRSFEITCSPSEDLAKKPGFMKKYGGHFDTVFFSPPYYRLELYAGKMQSTHRYKTYEAWLEGYWRKTVQLCYDVLQKEGKMCYIISDYGSENKEVTLVSDMNRITQKVGFKKVKIYKMFNKSVAVNKQEDNSESICVFVKN
jgi:hypothetical protein